MSTKNDPPTPPRPVEKSGVLYRLCVGALVCLCALPCCYGRVPYPGDLSSMPGQAPVGYREFNSDRGSTDEDRVTGQWMIEAEPESDLVLLSIRRRTESNGIHQSSFRIPLDNLPGLTRAQMDSNGSPVRFRIDRDAGTFDCEGWFKDGSGSGQFVFSAGQGYLSEMSKLGYDTLSNEQLFSMAVHEVGLFFVYGLKALGYEHPSVDQLITMRVHGVTTDFIIELKTLGYDHPSIGDLVSMRIHGVTTGFIKALKTLGYDRIAVDDLVGMEIHGVCPSFIEQMRARGLKNLSVDDLVRLRIHAVGK